MNRHILDKLREAGYSQQFNEALRAFLRDEGYTGQLNNAFYRYLGNLGYTNTLSERMLAFKTDGGSFLPQEPITNIEFGALTAVGAGGGAVTAPDGVYGSYTVVGGIATPNTSPVLPGTTVVGETTITTVANTYTVLGKTELVAAWAAARSTDTGATIKCRPGNYTDTFNTDVYKNMNVHTQRITIAADDPTNKPIFQQLHCKNWQYVTFDGLEVTRDRTLTFGGALVQILNGSGLTWDSRIIVQNCDIHSPFAPGGVTPDLLDPTILTVGSGGIEDWATYGVTTAGGSSPCNNIELRDNNIYYVTEAVSCFVQQRLDLIGNTITFSAGDLVKAPNNGGATFNCLWNRLGFNVGRNGDFGNTLHSDAIQYQGASADNLNHVILGNLFIGGDYRGDPLQLIFGDDWAVGFGNNGALIAYNIGHAKGSNAGIRMLHAKNITAHDNLFVTTSDSGDIRLEIGSDYTEGAHVVQYNVADLFNLPTSGSLGGTATVNSVNNLDVKGLYSTEFVGPAGGDFTVSPASFDELLSWFASKPGGTLFTANKNGGPLGTNNSRVDYVNRTYTALSA